MNERHLIVFPPFCGGHHLGQMMSTQSTDYTQQQLDTIYSDQRKEVDGYSQIYAHMYLRCTHIEGAISFIENRKNRLNQPAYQITLLRLPSDWHSAIGQRIRRRASWMQHDNVVDLHNLIYSAESVAKLLDLPRDSVYEIDSADMNRLTAAELLDKIPNLTPNLDVCELMHQRWQAMISR